MTKPTECSTIMQSSAIDSSRRWWGRRTVASIRYVLLWVGLSTFLWGQAKPRVTSDPVDQSVSVNSVVSFRVQVAEGSWTYQWLKNNADLADGGRISGAKMAVLTISGVQVADEAQYSVRISGAGGQTTSQAASLTVDFIGPRAPQIQHQPESQTISAGRDVSFSVSATGSPATFSYQWQIRRADVLTWTNVPANSSYIGATEPTLVVNNATAAMSGDSFRCTVSNGVPSEAVSAVATLMVTPAAPPPNDTFAARLLLSGNTVNTRGYSVGATRDPGEPVHAGVGSGNSVWWSWTAPSSGAVTVSTAGSNFDTVLAVYTGAAVATLTSVAANDDDEDAGDGSSEVSFNAIGGIAYHIAVDGFEQDTGEVALAVTLGGGAASVTITPASRDIAATGGAASLSVTSSGNWTANSGATWIAVSSGGSGSGNATVNYVVASNPTAEPRSGTLTVGDKSHTVNQAAGVSTRLTNLSIRTNAGTGAETLIVGFNLAGGGTKPLLIRGIGPTLASFGVSGTLADPTLQLFNGATVVTSNDNWGGSATIATAGTGVGAFALPTTSRDAALLQTLGVGSYTAQIGGGGGVALVEIYDVGSATDAKLSNVSARTRVGTGGDILIAGFAISGSGTKSVLIRGVGPTLGAFGVTGILTDPKLDLFSGATVIQSNDNWGGGASLITAFASVGAFALPTSSRDAALVASLQPGTYSVQISGVGGGSGVALVEVYELP